MDSSSKMAASVIPRQGIPSKQISEAERMEAEQSHALGYAARKRGDYKQAIDLYSKAIVIQPAHFKALFNRGFAYDKLGEF